MKGSDFENINMRAREAFIIACIENAVQHEGLTHPRWQVLIDGLWSMLSHQFFTDLEEYVSERCPEMIELFESYEEYLSQTDPDQVPPPLTEIEFAEYKEIYSSPSVASILLYRLDYFSASGVYGAHEPESDYEVLDKCILLLNSNNIPLPPFENFTPFLWIEGHTHSGPYTRQDFFPDLTTHNKKDKKSGGFMGFRGFFKFFGH